MRQISHKSSLVVCGSYWKHLSAASTHLLKVRSKSVLPVDDHHVLFMKLSLQMFLVQQMQPPCRGGGDTLILERGYSLAKLPRFFEGAEKLG